VNRGTVTAKCRRGHRRAEGRCGSRCLRWYYVVDMGPGPDGRRRRRWSAGFDRKGDASAALRAELDRLDQGVVVDPGKLTVAALAERWLQHVKTTRDEGTWTEYARNLRRHVLPALGGRQLKTLSPTDLDGLYARLASAGRLDGRPGGLSARTVRNIHKTVHKMLRQAVRWRLLTINPAADLELPPVVEPQMVTLDHQQARRLLEAAASPQRAGWWAPLVLLAVATGARRGELLALRWSDIDLDAGTVAISRSLRRGEAGLRYKDPKTRAGLRTVGLGPSTVAALRRLRAEQAERRLAFGTAYHAADDLVIGKVDGAPLRPDHVSSEFRRLAEAAGLPSEVHLHTLRHSAASFLAAAGVPASDIAAQLGHADGGSLALRVYVHPLEEGKRRAAAQLDQVIGGEHGR
jgi:integrase